MLAAARRHGLVSYQLAPRFEDLLRELAAGNPVIVLQNLGIGDGWHYAVAVGYDYDSGELILRSGTTERQVLAFTVHEMVWKRSGYWAMVALPPQRIPATANEQRWLGAVAALERAGPARACAYCLCTLSRALAAERERRRRACQLAPRAGRAARGRARVARRGASARPIPSSRSTISRRPCRTRASTRKRCLLSSGRRPPEARLRPRCRRPAKRFASASPATSGELTPPARAGPGLR